MCTEFYCIVVNEIGISDDITCTLVTMKMTITPEYEEKVTITKTLFFAIVAKNALSDFFVNFWRSIPYWVRSWSGSAC